MSKHQIIYTSCMRGIDGVNDGQQIFSYDRNFTDYNRDDVKSLFTYQVPSLPSGVLMSEEVARTMPSAFSYRLLKNGTCSLTLNTYLGRDYMGSAGRFGNHLSHSIICDFDEMIMYPCEVYGSSILRSKMEFSEVNNPEPPTFLPYVELVRGSRIHPDAITEFLGMEDRLEYLKKMVYAMLCFPKEKKRIVICDEAENIMMWISALEYTLPLDIAKKINFTTYEFDPELSPAQICGVIPQGSRYHVNTYITSGHHYVFDYINLRFSDMDATNAFLEFLDTAFSFSYDSLEAFKDFVMDNTTFREANEEYYVAYDLYNLLTNGISDITLEQFYKIITFVDTYTNATIKKEIIDKLVEDRAIINDLENVYALKILSYILQSMDMLDDNQKNTSNQLIVDRLIVSLANETGSEHDFLPLYNELDVIARSTHVNIPNELMKDNNKDALLQVMSQSGELWKTYFVVRVISDYVKDGKLSVNEFFPNRAIGNLYYRIIKNVYAIDKNGFQIIEQIMNNFKDDGAYLVYITLQIEGFLQDVSYGETDSRHIWDCFTSIILHMEDQEIDKINEAFLVNERFDEMNHIYKARIHAEKDVRLMRSILIDTLNNWLVKSNTYASMYGNDVLYTYVLAFEKISQTLSDDECFRYRKEILQVAMKMQVDADYMDQIIQRITDKIPLARLQQTHESLITDMRYYQSNIRRKRISDRMLLLCIGMDLDSVARNNDIINTVNEILQYADEKGADIVSTGEKTCEQYFEWILSKPLRHLDSKKDYTALFKLFKMSKKNERIFMEQCCKASYKRSKRMETYTSFSEFLAFMFTYGNQTDIDNTGRYLCKLNKKELEELDEEMKKFFRRDRKSAHKWDEVREIAEQTNSLLNNISGIFKRRKD